MRHLIFLLLLTALTSFGLSLHDNAMGGQLDVSASCHHHDFSRATHEDASRHCGANGDKMSDACAAACGVLLALWPRLADDMRIGFAGSAMWIPPASVLQGRLTEPDDHPPRSV